MPEFLTEPSEFAKDDPLGRKLYACTAHRQHHNRRLLWPLP